ncbi:protein-tyrosine-phosphatase [Cytophagaceae bacterium 50C-KIRBA]|uniref:Protein-tyrosine-phosphatase n=1 Tax=Aquirufa beregesia TaxID=2516556 RepID=A0ABX0F5K4_9BACT|nr:protein-tyrosine-phosphatase [Aquirufa beregesia]NGZ45135.1 protein-tyrosine-phosphatase [Aquirufa beregesia]
MYPALEAKIQTIRERPISAERKEQIAVLVAYMKDCLQQGKPLRLNFICTHNSRRSQFSQIWAQTAADFFGIPLQAYSGGVEETACNERAVASMQRFGFQVIKRGHANPVYVIFHTEDAQPMIAFSKIYDNPINPHQQFAAVMTCAHADENCPYISGASVRIPLRYEDPKMYDDSLEEAFQYDERSAQIASELFYAFEILSSYDL